MASKKYVPPNKRSKVPEIPERIDLSDKSFPVLGFVPTNSWNSHVVSDGQTQAQVEQQVKAHPVTNTLSSRIQEAMKQQEEAEQDEYVKQVAQDAMEGWHLLSLKSAQEVAGHFNSTGEFRGVQAYED